MRAAPPRARRARAPNASAPATAAARLARLCSPGNRQLDGNANAVPRRGARIARAPRSTVSDRPGGSRASLLGRARQTNRRRVPCARRPVERIAIPRIEHRVRAALQHAELRLDQPLARTHDLQVRVADVRDDRHFGLRHLHQRNDVAEMAAAHLHHAQRRLRLQAQQRLGDPDLVVLVALRSRSRPRPARRTAVDAAAPWWSSCRRCP